MSDNPRVRPSAQYHEQFPRCLRGHGTIVSRDGDLATVQWDGGYSEELHVDFLDFPEGRVEFKAARAPRADIRARQKRSANNEKIAKNRQIIRAAFDKIRHDPKQKTLVNLLAKCLGGSGELTDHLWRTVQDLTADRANRPNQSSPRQSETP